MPQNKIYIDKLELAYQQNPEFTELLSPPKRDGEDNAFGWERDITEPFSPPIIPSYEDADILDNDAVDDFLNSFVIDGSCDSGSTPWEDTVTIGNWHFVRGKFPGTNTNYKYNFRVEHDTEDGDTSVFGFLYYVTYRRGREENIYLSLANYKLYDEGFWQELRSFETDFGLSFVHVSKVDIALDGVVDTSKVIYNLMKRDKSIDWVINGHRIVDRNATIKKLFWILSGSLDNPDANRVLYIKQKEGLTINCYCKTIEIEDKSQKYYQIGDWEVGENGILDDDSIYRNEIRLTRKDIGHYIKLHGMDELQFRNSLEDKDCRFNCFREFCRKLIRWNRNGKSQDITTLVQNRNYCHGKEKAVI